jgi:hypothetical protein
MLVLYGLLDRDTRTKIVVSVRRLALGGSRQAVGFGSTTTERRRPAHL